MSSTLDGRVIRRYLLGELSEAEATALELKYFDDPEAFEQVWAAENDLVDDHAAGRLEPDERVRFDAHYLASPRHRQRSAVAQALQRSRARTVQVAKTMRVAAKPRRPRLRIRPLHLALAAVVVVALVAYL
jgi:hypothetical protein